MEILKHCKHEISNHYQGKRLLVCKMVVSQVRSLLPLVPSCTHLANLARLQHANETFKIPQPGRQCSNALWIALSRPGH